MLKLPAALIVPPGSRTKVPSEENTALASTSTVPSLMNAHGLQVGSSAFPSVPNPGAAEVTDPVFTTSPLRAAG